MPAVVTTETEAARNSATSMIRSLTLRSCRRARRSLTKSCGTDTLRTTLTSELRFELHQLLDREADFVLAFELGAGAQLAERFHVVAVSLGRQRHVLHFLRELLAV